MKNHLFFAAAMLISVAAHAQNKGDRYVAGTLGLNCENQTTILKQGAFSYTNEQPYTSVVEIAAEYGFFVANNLRVAMAVGASWGSTPTSEQNWGWTKSKALALCVSPKLAYHQRLTDNFYYTPEIGVSFERGTLSEQTSKTETSKYPALAWEAYAHLLAFEFKVSEKIALGTNIGSIKYASITISDDSYKNDKSEIVTNKLKFTMNESSVFLRFYY